jgi:hypothetical protein
MSDPHWRWTYMIIAVTASIIVASLITYGSNGRCCDSVCEVRSGQGWGSWLRCI